MLDLEKFGVLEMNAQEVKEVEGGFLPIAVVVAIWAIEVGACCSMMSMYSARKK